MDSKCEHLNFEVEAKVSRIMDARKELRLMVSLLVRCKDCNKTFAVKNPVLPGNMAVIEVESET